MKNLLLSLLVCLSMGSVAQSTHTINFEPIGVGAAWNWVVVENGDNPPLEIIANPVSGGINTSSTVAKFTARAAGNPWALCFTDDDGEFTFNVSNATVKIMVFKPVTSNVGIKFEGMSLPVEILIPNTLINEWEELTFDFSGSIGNTYSRIVIIPDFAARAEDHIIYFDNIQVPNGVPTGPLPEPANQPPVPPHAEANVLSIYSDTYTDLAGTNFNPNWGQSTTVTVDYLAAGNNTLKYSNLNYQGTELPGPQNVASYQYFHIDFWTPNSTSLSFYLISPGPVETPFVLDISQESWVSVDIPLSAFAPVDLSNVFQFKVVGNGTVYFDNWYFWKSSGGAASDATLSDLKVNGTTVAGFDPGILSYNYELPAGSPVPTVTATPTNPFASVVINDATALPGTTQVIVTSQDETVTITYNVNFVLTPVVAAPTPTQDPGDVISMFSDAYTDVPVDTW
ncbi:MAG: cadherin-like beta sandwich domain-containing protein, partial [Bacteroidales bacterium]|nr:cadherin-like beta sandwich domain-containing protein [Bacteroidales bacterium]